MNRLVILFIIIILAQSTDEVSQYPFEKKLWSFWDAEDLSSAPLIVQACYEKIKRSAAKAGFQYTLLNSKNVHEYIENYDQKITQVRQKSYQKPVQHFADLVRFHIIHDHGGIWMDITEVLLQDFDWILSIKSEKYRKLITNRFSQNVDVLLFYFSAYQNVREYRIYNPKNSSEMMLYNEMPGYEIWFLAAKKNNPLIGQIKDMYSNFTQTTYWDMMARFARQNIYMNNQDGDAYLSGNMAISYVLQRKQFELDRNLSLFGGQRSTAYEYYNVWSLSGLLGPLTWTNWQKVPIADLMEKSKEELEEVGCVFNFFVKLVGDATRLITRNLAKMKEIFVEKGMTLDEYIQTKPGMKECEKMKFLVEESFVDEIFKGTDYLSKANLTAITKEQNKKWRDYCNGIRGESFGPMQFIDHLLFFFRYQVLVSWYKAHQIVNYPQDPSLTLSQRTTKFIDYNWGFIYFFYRIVINAVLFYSVHVFVAWLWMKYVENRQNMESKRQSMVSCLKMIFLLVFLVSLSAAEHYSIDMLGMRDDRWTILIVVFVIYVLQHRIEKNLEELPQGKTKYYSEMFYECIYFIISYWTVYMCLSNILKNKVALQFHSMVLGVFAPIILKLISRLNQSYRIPHYLSVVLNLSGHNLFRKSTIFILFVVNLIPHSRYWTVSQHYAISYLPYLPTFMAFALYVAVFMVVLEKKISIEILRMALVGIFIVAFYYMIPWKSYHVIANQKRLCWNLQIVSLFAGLRLQLGNSFRNKDNTEELSIQTLLRYFGIFTLALTAGSAIWIARVNTLILMAIIQLGIILLNNMQIYLYGYFKYSKVENQRDGQFVKFTQIQMESQQEQNSN